MLARSDLKVAFGHLFLIDMRALFCVVILLLFSPGCLPGPIERWPSAILLIDVRALLCVVVLLLFRDIKFYEKVAK